MIKDNITRIDIEYFNKLMDEYLNEPYNKAELNPQKIEDAFEKLNIDVLDSMEDHQNII